MKFSHYFSIGVCFREYSLAHQKDIVQCVVRYEAYDLVKGIAVWKMMEKKKVK
jgi:hypothetical protein